MTRKENKEKNKDKQQKNRNLLLLRFPRVMDVDAIRKPPDPGPGAEMDPERRG